jgi:PIN domain-containing protein
MKNLDALIFIDTNIYLDFYRIRRSDISMSYLDLIDKNKKHIITGSQIEMEFKKNRQKVILESLKQFKTPDWGNLSAPALLAESQAMQQIERKKKEIGTQQKKINQKIEKILNNPSRNDPVFTTLNRLFRHKSKTNLDRENKIRFKIRNLAKKRFVLGYPPRKNDDISIGDAVNWEWIIYCAQNSSKDIIIVTRDSDFGAIVKGESYLNDWLRLEFKERVSRKRNIFLTDKLASAFKAIKLPVSKAMIEEEARILSTQKEEIIPRDLKQKWEDIVRLLNVEERKKET